MDLPDDVLCAILRCLPTREAVKTSTLSKRWRYLWASALADIDFDEINMLKFGFPDHTDTSTEPSQWFATTVNHFLGLHTASKIHTFRICFNSGVENNEHIDRWVTFAIKKQAEKIIFNFCADVKRCSFPLGLLDDGRVSSWLKHLHLSSGILGHVNQVHGLASLKSLTLQHVTLVNGHNLQGLISGCPLLESLSLKYCRGLDNIRIDSSFGRLKHLHLACFASVVISCLSLISLKLYAADRVCLCDDHELDSLQLPLREGEDGTCFYITTLFSSDLRRFSSLRSVIIRLTDYRGHDLANLLSACPNLESLYLDCCDVFWIPFHHNLTFLDLKNIYFDPEEPMPEVEIFCGPNLISLQWKQSVFQKTTIKLVNSDGRVFSSSSPSMLRKLCITECISSCSNYAAFKYLQELAITPVGLGDDDILSLLSHCSCLERLSLSGGDSQLRHFKIPFPSHPLNYLELKDNKFLRKIELCSTNLTTFVLHTTFMVPLCVDQAPRLTRVYIGSWWEDTRDETIRSIKELPVLIPQLETLTLFVGGSSSALDEDMLIGVPEFKHLKQLVVNLVGSPQSVLWMVSLIQMAPNLHTFELHLGNSRLKPNVQCFPNEIQQIKYYHNHLKEVKITGFFGWNHEMEMATYLLKYATSLEFMTIDPNPWLYNEDGTWTKQAVIISGFRSIRRWLMKHVSSSTRLVIL